MAGTDPLLALRHAIKTKSEINYVSSTGEPVASLQAATHVQLGSSPSTTLRKAAPTRVRKPSAAAAAAASAMSDPESAPGDFVTLEALLVAWLARDASVAEYMKQVRDAGIGAFVSITERKGVVEWLEGKVADHERIVPLAGGECWFQQALFSFALVKFYFWFFFIFISIFFFQKIFFRRFDDLRE